MSNFICDPCQIVIAPYHPRVHCLVCTDYDLCANCHLGERFTAEHAPSHSTVVLKMSGQVPTTTAADPTYAPPMFDGSSRPIPPPLPPRRSRPTSTGASQGGWKPFFNDDLTPTPTFVHLMNAIFSHLDTTNLGYLSPEIYSSWLDDCGYSTAENAWKNNLTILYGHRSKEDVADLALKNAFDLFGFEHVLRPRHPSGPASMPLLTRTGFIEITSLEMLAQPSAEYNNLRRVLTHYRSLPCSPSSSPPSTVQLIGMIEAWGNVPRMVLPEYPDERVLARVRNATVVGAEKAKRDLAAVAAQCELEAIGRQNAIDLISGDRHEYRYVGY